MKSREEAVYVSLFFVSIQPQGFLVEMAFQTGNVWMAAYERNDDSVRAWWREMKRRKWEEQLHHLYWLMQRWKTSGDDTAPLCLSIKVWSATFFPVSGRQWLFKRGQTAPVIQVCKEQLLEMSSAHTLVKLIFQTLKCQWGKPFHFGFTVTSSSSYSLDCPVYASSFDTLLGSQRAANSFQMFTPVT